MVYPILGARCDRFVKAVFERIHTTQNGPQGRIMPRRMA